MSKKVKILDLIENLSETRNGIPQFLFAEAIHPNTMIEVRDEVLSFKKEFEDVNEIDFIINSPGGSPADAYRIIRTLRNNFETVNVIVPFWAKSAATLLSLGANKIIMDEFGEFGPLDIQIAVERDDSPEIDRESALNDEYSVRRIEARSQELYYQMFTNLYSSNDIKINKIELSKQLLEYLASFYKPLLSQINPYHLGRKKRMLEIGHNYADRILSTYHPNLPDRNKAYLIDYLVNGCPDHGYVIDYNLISQFLTNVSKSSELGVIYENLLTEISSELITQEDFTYVGFIVKQNQEENEILPIPQELLNNGIDNKTTEQKKPKAKTVVTKPITKKINPNGKKTDPAN